MMRIDRRRALLGLAAGLGSAGFLGPRVSAFAQPTEDWGKIVDAAKKEGEVVLYTGNVGSPTQGQIAKAFEKKYGIAVRTLDARASELRERIRMEQAAGRFAGDLLQNGSTTTALQMQEGVLQPHGGLPSQGKLVPPLKADEIRVPIFVLAYGILVNTNMVKPADEPKSWKDILNPKWKGKIVSDDMRALGGGSVFFFVTQDKFGRGFHEELAKQQLQFTRDIREAERRVARGEFAMWIPQQVSGMPALKGLPIKFITPQEGYTYVAYEHAMLKNAPHPNAARLLMEFYLGEEAQLIYANLGNIPAVQGMIEKAAPDMRAIESGKLMGTTDPARQDAMLVLAKEIYK